MHLFSPPGVFEFPPLSFLLPSSFPFCFAFFNFLNFVEENLHVVRAAGALSLAFFFFFWWSSSFCSHDPDRLELLSVLSLCELAGEGCDDVFCDTTPAESRTTSGSKLSSRCLIFSSSSSYSTSWGEFPDWLFWTHALFFLLHTVLYRVQHWSPVQIEPVTSLISCAIFANMHFLFLNFFIGPTCGK